MNHWSDGFTETACDAGIKEARQYATFADWWAGGENGEYMIRALYEIGYDDQRALRLLAVRFVRETTLSDGRTVWDLLEDERSREAVIVAERYVNGEASGDRLTEVWTAAREVAAKAGRTVGEGAEAIAWAAQAAKAATGAVWTEVWTAPWAAALGAGAVLMNQPRRDIEHAESRAVAERSFEPVAEVGVVDDELAEAGGVQAFDVPHDQRLAARLEQRLGGVVGERAHALSATGGEDHRSGHGVSAEGSMGRRRLAPRWGRGAPFRRCSRPGSPRVRGGRAASTAGRGRASACMRGAGNP